MKKKILIVAGTVIVAFSMIMIGLPLSKLLGFEINEMAASGFSPSIAKVSMFLLLTILYFAIVYLSQRFLHKAPFKVLGFKKPVIRHILIAFVIGIVINFIPFAAILLTAKNMVYASAIPEGVSLLRVAVGYFFFLFIWLTVNSIGEELVFRSYPIEQFADQPRALPFVVLSAAIVFALLHFIVREPSLNGFFMLSLTSIFYSMIYLNWRSIWVLVGVHNGMNFINLTFSENWEMGGLFTWNGEGMAGLDVYLNVYHFAVPIVATAFLYRRYMNARQLS